MTASDPSAGDRLRDLFELHWETKDNISRDLARVASCETTIADLALWTRRSLQIQTDNLEFRITNRMTSSWIVGRPVECKWPAPYAAKREYEEIYVQLDVNVPLTVSSLVKRHGLIVYERSLMMTGDRIAYPSDALVSITPVGSMCVLTDNRWRDHVEFILLDAALEVKDADAR